MINYLKKRIGIMNKKTKKIVAWVLLILMLASVAASILAYML